MNYKEFKEKLNEDAEFAKEMRKPSISWWLHKTYIKGRILIKEYLGK